MNDKVFSIYESYFVSNYLPTIKSPNYHSIVDVMYMDVFLESPLPKVYSNTHNEIYRMIQTLHSSSMRDDELHNIFNKMHRYSIVDTSDETYRICHGVILEVIQSNRTKKDIMGYDKIRHEVLQAYHQYKFLEVIKSI